jgi:hypothetical protein
VDCGVKWCHICNFDNDSIIFLGINYRSRKYSVDRDHVLAIAKFCDSRGLHLFTIETFINK